MNSEISSWLHNYLENTPWALRSWSQQTIKTRLRFLSANFAAQQARIAIATDGAIGNCHLQLSRHTLIAVFVLSAFFFTIIDVVLTRKTGSLLLWYPTFFVFWSHSPVWVGYEEFYCRPYLHTKSLIIVLKKRYNTLLRIQV